MFRKLTLIVAATAAIGAAALAPTTASAKPWGWGWHHHHHHWHGGYGFYSPTYIVGGDCYIVRRVVHTYYGVRIRRVEVCG